MPEMMLSATCQVGPDSGHGRACKDVGIAFGFFGCQVGHLLILGHELGFPKREGLLWFRPLSYGPSAPSTGTLLVIGLPLEDCCSMAWVSSGCGKRQRSVLYPAVLVLLVVCMVFYR